jgi:small subunit ribosomal protein S11
MGKRTVKKEEGAAPEAEVKKTETAVSTGNIASSKKKVESARLCVESTYNNTKVVLTDMQGNSLASSSSGALGFAGAKKGTPFAAAKVGETLAIKAAALGVKEITVFVKGVGSGREAAIRGFVSRGTAIRSISDITPVPHNGPKPPRPRRV